jgi:polysaccharide export outer membrane protein
MRRMIMKHPIASSGLACLMVLSSLTVAVPVFAQTRGARSSEQDGRTTPPDEYRIGPEDTLAIAVWKNESLTRTVPVRPDGKISLPLLNDVQAAGLSALQLRDVLAQKLGAYMPSPEVSVIVTDIRSFKVSVIGEISRPGRLELRSWTTVLDALALSGGFTPFASRSKIVILQPDGKTMKRIPFNYNKALDGEQENFYLRNGDIILVP